MKKKMLFVILAVIIVGGVGYFAFVRKPSPITDKAKDENFYRDEQYGFSFRYPIGWRVIETTASLFHTDKNKPVKVYSLFKTENVELSGDRGKFLVNLYVFTKQSGNRVTIEGGPDSLFGYNFTEDNFSAGFTGAEDKEYTWESIKSESDIQTSDGMAVIKRESSSFSPNQVTETYFTVNGDRDLALLFEFEYRGEDQELWMSRSRFELALQNEQKVVEVRNLLEATIQSLTFSNN